MKVISYIQSMAGNDTKSSLMDTAERLFAEYGIEAVSAWQIALAAGQRNESAIAYHFGSKDDLVRALHADRMHAINEHRAAMLGQAADDAHALIACVVHPLAEYVRSAPGGANYVRFLAHVFADRHRRDALISGSSEGALIRKILERLRKHAPAQVDALWNERIRFVVGGLINALASRERVRPARTLGREDDRPFIQNLIDAAVGALLAKPSSSAPAVARKDLSRRQHVACRT